MDNLIYVDMDGVVADFDAGLSKLVNKNYNSAGKRGWYKIADEDWAAVRREKDFWLNLPKMPSADRLMEAIKESYKNIKFLTAGGSDEKAFDQKPLWIKKHFGNYEVIVVEKRMEKILYCKKDVTLIDDHNETIERWKLMGGIGILYVDPIKAGAN